MTDVDFVLSRDQRAEIERQLTATGNRPHTHALWVMGTNLAMIDVTNLPLARTS